MRFLLVLCIVFAGAVLAGIVSRPGEGVEAGTAVRMSVSELAQNAELIVEARVLSAFPIELPDGRIAFGPSPINTGSSGYNVANGVS